MKNIFLPEDLSFQLKEKGFREDCFGYYQSKDISYVEKGLKFGSAKHIGNHNIYDDFICSAPLYQQVVDWFRDNHNLAIIVAPSLNLGKFYMNITYINNIEWFRDPELQNFDTYYEAYDYAIEEALKLI